MTREEAIRILDPDTTGEALAEIEYYNGFNGKTAAVQAVSDACVLAVAALREQGERRWIPVTERLPEEDGDYLVFKRFAGNAWSDVVSFAKDGRQVNECTFVEKWQNVWYYYDSEWGYIRTNAVTHWMPLPQPPKGE